jgi:hypothetical protein
MEILLACSIDDLDKLMPKIEALHDTVLAGRPSWPLHEQLRRAAHAIGCAVVLVLPAPDLEHAREAARRLARLLVRQVLRETRQ